MGSLLREPALDNVDIDSGERIAAHRDIILKKPMAREVFTELQTTMRELARPFDHVPGLRIELGAGAFPMKLSFPEVIATDLVASPHLDRVLDAQDMALPDKSVGVFYAQNTFHHLPQPKKFFAEMVRTLAPGGGAVLLEPYYGPVASQVFSRLFKTEGFDKAQVEWETPAQGPMNGANQALSYIVFVRDKARLTERFPNISITSHIVCSNYMRYVISGGVNFRQLLPDAFTPVLKAAEWCLSPARSVFALHHIVVLSKT